MVAMSVLPESPVWLKWKGQGSDAVAASKRLLGGSLQGSAIEQTEGSSPGVEEPLVAPYSSEVRVLVRRTGTCSAKTPVKRSPIFSPINVLH